MITSGPWEISHWGDNEIDIYGADNKLICALAQDYDETTGKGTNESIEEDAQLIAAAPRLLEAVKLLIALENNDVHAADIRWKTARKVLREAVAQAEGVTT